MTIWMFLPMLVALAGCEPEPLPVSFGVESGEQEVTTFDFGVMSYEGPSTKAYAADVEDGLVDRIDIFMYDGSGNIYGHKVIGEYGGGALDLNSVTFRDSDGNGVVRSYLFIPVHRLSGQGGYEPVPGDLHSLERRECPGELPANGGNGQSHLR